MAEVVSNSIEDIPFYGFSPASAGALLLLLFATIGFLWSRLRQEANSEFSYDLKSYKMLGRPHESRPEHNSHLQRASLDERGAATTWKVEGLWIYPIKSCRGVELQKGTVTGNGFQYDRQFAFARYQKTSKPSELERWEWVFVTQRSVPRMATIRTEIWLPDLSTISEANYHSSLQNEGVLVIKYDGGKGRREKTVHLPFSPGQEQIRQQGYEMKKMTIWRDSPDALMMASTVSGASSHALWIERIRTHLGLTAQLALFRFHDPSARQLFRNAPRQGQLGYQPSVSFQDAYPLHIINVASVEDVAKRFDGGETNLSFRNFRPNIVVSGGQAYSEDAWKYIRIGDAEYHVSCRTMRCLLPNVDPISGHRREEPNKTLKSFRRIDEGDPTNACLGMQMVPAARDKRRIKVGDSVVILEEGDHKYVKI